MGYTAGPSSSRVSVATLLLLLLLLPPSCSATVASTRPLVMKTDKTAPELTLQQLETTLEEAAERFEGRMDRWTLHATEQWQHQLADVMEKHERGLAGSHRPRRRRDVAGLPEELWYSYQYNTGVGNREELTLHGLYSGNQLNISGPALDAPPQWQVVSHRGMFFLFGLYPFAGTTKLHIVKTDFKGLFVQHTVDFSAADLRVTPFLHYVHSSHRVQLFVFVKRTVPVTGLYAGDVTHPSEQIFCFIVDQDTLHTTEACAPVTLPSGKPTGEVLVNVLMDSYSGTETIALFPVRQTRGLVAYKLRSVPYSDSYTLGLHTSIETNSSVWKVRLFSVSGNTYVVVSYGDGPLDSMVQVFRYDSGVFSLVQTIAVTNIVIDIEVFSIGFQHYLALGQESRMSLYVWHYAEFESLQDEPSPLTYKWTVITVTSCRHEVILAKVFNSVGYQVEFYVHNVRTRQFDQVPSVPCAAGSRSGEGLRCFQRPEDVLDLSQLVGVTTKGATYMIVPSKTHQLILVTVNATVDLAPDPVRLQNKHLMERKAALQAQYDALLRKIERIEAVLERAVVPGSHQTLTGDYNFFGHVTADTLEAPGAAINRVRLAGFSGDIFNLVAPLTELTHKVSVLEAAMADITARLRDVVQADSPSVVISGHKTLVSSVSIDSLSSTGSVYINTVNGRDLNNTLSNIVRVDSGRLISGTKTVTSSLNVSFELTAGLLNGRPVSDIVTTDTIQELDGPLLYATGALQVDVLSVTGLVGGLNTQKLALYHGTGKLPVAVSIDSLTATSLSVGRINGQSPADVFSHVLLGSGGTFTESVTFDGSVTLPDIRVNGTLNGEDAATCLSSVLFTDSAHSLDALWLSRATVSGDLAADTVYSRPFPGGSYVRPGGSHVISGAKTLGRVSTSRVTAGRVDGLPVTQFVTLDTDQTLAELRVTSAHVLGALTVGGTIDGVRVEPGWLDHLLTNSSQTLDADVVFAGEVTQLGDLGAVSINGAQLPQLVSRLMVAQPGQTVSVTGKKRFTAAVTTGAVTVHGLVNGADPADWLTVTGDQLVVGELTLMQRGFFASVIAAGQVDGVDLGVLIQDALYTTAEQQQLVFGSKSFSDAVVISTLLVDGTVNGVQAGDVFWTREDQIVTGTHTYLGAVRAGGLHAHGALHVPDGARIGGLDFSELPARAAVASNETHAQKLVFDRVIVRGDVVTDRLNGLDIRRLTTSVLRRGGGRVTGRWTFESLSVNGSVATAAGAGGFHLGRLRHRAVSLVRDGTVSAPLTFERLVVSGGAVRGQVVLGGVPWEEALANLARHNAPIFINASKTFSGGLHVNGEIRSPSLPLQNVLLVGAEQIITGAAFFHSDVTFHAGLTVQQPINGQYDVTQIATLFVTDTDDVTVNGDLVLWGDTSISSLSVSGLLADRPITTLFSSAVRLSGDAYLTGRLTFLSPVHAATLHLTDGRLNGRDLAAYLATVRLATEDQVFSGAVVAAQVTVRTATIRHLTVHGLLDGVNCTDLIQRVILLDGDYTFSGLWTLPGLTVAGNLNVLSLNGQLPSQLLRLDGASTLTHLTIIGDVHSAGVANASLATTLNGINLWTEVNNRFRLSHPGTQTVLGEITFTGNVVINGSVVLGGHINGFNTSQLVVLGSSNTILGNFQLSGGVTADSVIVDGLVGGVNISQCAASAVYPDQNHTLHGEYAITAVRVAGFSSVHPFDVAKSRAEVTSLLQQCEHQHRDFNSFFSSQCLAMQNLYDDMRSTYYAVRYFDEVQELTWPDLGTIISSLVLEDLSGLQVLVTYTRRSGGCPESRLLRWHPGSGRLRLAGAPYRCGAVRQWRRLRLGGRDLLVSAAVPSPAGCTAPLSAVWQWNHGYVQPVQSLDVSATQVQYTEAPLGVPSLLLLDPTGGKLWRLTYNPDSGNFGIHPPQPTHAKLLAVRALLDGSLLKISAEGSTVVVRRESLHQGTLLQGTHHQQTLGALTATALFTFTRRGRLLFAVGDGGWSSLVNSPQGVKIFEYFGNGTHRCVPAQHLPAVSPSDLAQLAAGSLPDLFMVVVERDCGLRIFIDKGEAGFVEFQRVTLPGAESVTVAYPTPESPPHLLVSAGPRLVVLAAQMMGAHVQPVAADCERRLPELQLGLDGEGQVPRATGAVPPMVGGSVRSGGAMGGVGGDR